jgi:hypothetical protein
LALQLFEEDFLFSVVVLLGRAVVEAAEQFVLFAVLFVQVVETFL